MGYCVYKHTSPSNKVYIGISINPKRRWGANGTGYKGQDYFWNAICKYGWDNFRHEILYDNLSKTEAEIKERALIKEYNSTNHSYGYNILPGGNIGASKPVTMYSITGRLIRRYDSAVDAATDLHINPDPITFCANGHVMTSYGYVWRYDDCVFDTYRVRKDIGKIKVKYKGKIIQYDFNGNQIGTFNSIAEAEKITNTSSISSCLQGITNSAGGFIWRRENENFNLSKKTHIMTNHRVCNRSELIYNKTKIYEYNLNGELVNIHKSIYDIPNLTSKQRSNIIRNAKEYKTGKNRIYSFERDFELEKNGGRSKEITSIRCPVDQYSLDGIYIKTFPAIYIAEKETGATNIALCVNGTRIQSGGYVWRYKGESFNKYRTKKVNKVIIKKYDNIPVYQYDLSGNLISIYESVYTIPSHFGYNANIQKCLLGKLRSTKGCMYSFGKNILMERFGYEWKDHK